MEMRIKYVVCFVCLLSLTQREVFVLVRVNKAIYYMTGSFSGQDESIPLLWLATREVKMEPSWPLGIARSSRVLLSFNSVLWVI